MEEQVSARVRAYLREAMEEREYDKATMSRLLGINDANLGRLLNGERKKFSAGMIVLISRICQVNPTRLLYKNPPTRFFEGEDPPPEIE